MPGTAAERQMIVRGAVAELVKLAHNPPAGTTEALLSGPAGTGKTYGVLSLLIQLCIDHPGCRVLIARKVRSSMAETTLTTLDEALSHRGIRVPDTARQHRSGYRIGKSEIVVGGFDNPEKLKSSQYDVLYVNEATELNEEDWEIALSRLRNGSMKGPNGTFHLAIADCNPAQPSHWLNCRQQEGGMLALRSHHHDNPRYFNPEAGEWTPEGKSYIGTLNRLSGVRYKRLSLGQWCATEGVVYEDFEPGVHVIDPADAATGRLVFSNRGEIRWTLFSVDWGFRDPGVIQVWGVDGDKRMYRMAEIYRTGETIDWWKKRAVELAQEFSPRKIVCDPSQPGYIDQMRRAGLPVEGHKRKQDAGQDFESRQLSYRPGDIRLGIDAVSSRLRKRGDGTRGLYFVRDANRHIDESLRNNRQPWCTEQEIESYVYEESVSGKPNREAPIDAYNHGCDGMRYGVMYVERASDISVGMKPLAGVG